MTSLLLTASILFSGAPAGFESPGLIERLRKGETVKETRVDTRKEFHFVHKAYYRNVTPEAFAGLAVNHQRYPELFQEVVSGATLRVDHGAGQYDYRLHVRVDVGLFRQDAHPEGTHVVTKAPAEWKIANRVTNYPHYAEVADQRTRLIPWEGGILIEDEVHVRLKQNNPMSRLIRNKLHSFFSGYLTVFRRELER